jgi:hypothetical protein
MICSHCSSLNLAHAMPFVSLNWSRPAERHVRHANQLKTSPSIFVGQYKSVGKIIVSVFAYECRAQSKMSANKAPDEEGHEAGWGDHVGGTPLGATTATTTTTGDTPPLTVDGEIHNRALERSVASDRRARLEDAFHGDEAEEDAGDAQDEDRRQWRWAEIKLSSVKTKDGGREQEAVKINRPDEHNSSSSNSNNNSASTTGRRHPETKQRAGGMREESQVSGVENYVRATGNLGPLIVC